MPKERFTDGEFSYEISWHPESGDVQVGVTHCRARVVLLEPQGSYDSDDPRFDLPLDAYEPINLYGGGGFFFHLKGWDEVNRAVRIHKRARDHIWTPA
jgi:hypothetical protein